MRILITGGKGQLGRALAEALRGDVLLPVDLPELDITDEDAFRRAVDDFRPDLVIHAAALTDTVLCERRPGLAHSVNAAATSRVAEICRVASASILYVSTNEVFDGEKGSPYLEDDEPNPLNEYARSKLAGETAVRETLDRHYIVRTSWLYGPGRVSFPEKILNAAREQGRLRLVTDEIASPTRTFDLARGIAELIARAPFGTYHLTNSGGCSRKQWAEEVLRLAEIDVPVEAATQADFGAPYRKPVDSRLANTRAAALGIELRPWEEALAEHMAYLRQEAAAGAEARG